jgi:hypothetical protein
VVVVVILVPIARCIVDVVNIPNAATMAKTANEILLLFIIITLF